MRRSWSISPPAAVRRIAASGTQYAARVSTSSRFLLVRRIAASGIQLRMRQPVLAAYRSGINFTAHASTCSCCLLVQRIAASGISYTVHVNQFWLPIGPENRGMRYTTAHASTSSRCLSVRHKLHCACTNQFLLDIGPENRGIRYIQLRMRQPVLAARVSEPELGYLAWSRSRHFGPAPAPP